jgi:2-polyprenyl-3-methyl-5-hydroxy-6-metoxy-1,4-benzoquinol methylase
MDKSSRKDIALQDQRKAWNQWNAEHRELAQGEVSRRQAELVEKWIFDLGHKDLNVIDIGCGAGWMCERLSGCGRVTGTDLADEVVARAKQRLPTAHFVAGDFFELEFAPESFDVAVSLEVLSHVADQPAFLKRIAGLLRPGGLLMLATQNRPILERWSAIGGPMPGQIRRWVDAPTLRSLLNANFEVVQMTSVLPVGDQGLLRLINSGKLNRALRFVVGQSCLNCLNRVKERFLLGHTLMVLARKRN